MFINCSNHNSKNWSDEQLICSKEYGEIVDYAFPAVSAKSDSEEVKKIAENVAKEIINMKPDCVMCQGEFTLTYAIVHLLKKAGIKVVAACSERNATEIKRPDGSIEKNAVYQFVRYREY